MDIKQMYREETNLDVYAEHSLNYANYTNEYVYFLEKKLKEAINYNRCSAELKCGECDCKIKYPDIGCDTIKDCKKTH